MRFVARQGRGVCVALLLLCVVTAYGQRKKRIAVLSFEMGSDSLQTAQRLGAKDDLGLALSNLLVNDLAGGGKVQIVERSALDKILKEQNLSNTDRMDNTMAARIGKIAGVDAILICSVTQFVGSIKETGGSRLMVGLSGGKNNAHQMETKVSIVTTARLIDVNTGVVMTTAQGQGDAKHVEMEVATGANNQQMGNPVLNEATMKAIKTLSDQLNGSSALTETVAIARVAYKGPVADVDTNTLVLAIGTSGGVRVGDVVQISREGRTIKDPKTGAVLKTMYDPLGTAKITEADEKTATATYSGTKPVKVNDTAAFVP